MPGIGIRIGPSRQRGKSAAAAFVGMVLSGSGSQAEGTATGTAIGTLSVVGGTGTYTFTKTADPDSAFTLTAGVLKNAIVFDYETAATHSVTLHADNGAGSTFDLTVGVAVTDVAAPVLSAATGTKTGSTTATLGVTTDSGNGTLYAVATTSATNPTAAQVKAGQDHTGAAAAFAGSQAISSSGAKTINATGLTASTAYFGHFMHEGLPAEQSAVVASASFTTDAIAAPVNTVAPAVTGTATVGQTLTTTNGTWTNSPSSYAYQWYTALVDGSNNVLVDGSGNPLGVVIGGATASTYVLQAGDAGNKIFCTVTATNAGGSTAADSNVTAAVGSDSAAYTNFIAGTTGLDAPHLAAYKAFLDGLTADGLFNSDGTTNFFDYLYIFATKDATTANLNLVSSSFTITPSAFPTFTADSGYKAANSASVLSTGFNPSTATSPKYTRDSAHISLWNLDNATSAEAAMGNDATGDPGGVHMFIKFTADSKLYTRINDGTGAGNTNTTPTGLIVGSRSSSTNINQYVNGSSIGTVTATSAAPLNAAVSILASGSASSDLAHGIAAATIGAALDGSNQTNFYNRLHTYMQTIAGVP